MLGLDMDGKKGMAIPALPLFLGMMLVGMIYPQDQDNPTQFLDPAFLEGVPEASQTSSESEINFEEETSSEIPSTVNFNFDLILLPRYNLINSDNLYDPQGALYFPNFDNLIQVHNQLKYTFWQRRLSFHWDSTLYLLSERDDSSKIALTSETEYDLNELSLNLNWGDHVTLGIGKINIGEGTAFLSNPTDFLDRRPNFRDFSLFYRNRSVGSYQIQLNLLFQNLGWSIAYLPEFDTEYEEFSRGYNSDRDSYFGEVWSRISWQVGNLKTKFLFYWNGYPQGGVNLTGTLGDEVVWFFDGAAKAVPRPGIVENGEYTFPGPDNTSLRYDRYRFEEKYDYRGQGTLGITYTPVDLFTLSVEVYTSIGEENRYWDEYKDDLADLESIAGQLERSAIPNLNSLAGEYWGVMHRALEFHNPLNLQPLFVGVGISRNDAFSKYITAIFNFSTRLIYSPLDTGFLWVSHANWEAPEVVTLGLFTTWYFGSPQGVFTSVPRNFSVGLATRFSF